MYRILLAVGILIVVVGCCAGTLIAQTHIFTNVESQLTSIETAYDNDEIEQCHILTDELIDYYESQSEFLLFFSKNKGIEDLMVNLKKLPYYLELEPAIFKSELEMAQGNLEVLKLQDIPNFVNII